MMDFELTEEQRMIQEMAYKFAVKEFLPVSGECDREEKYTPEIVKKPPKTGWLVPGYQMITAARGWVFSALL